MKYQVISLCILFMLASCDGQNKSKTQTPEIPKQESKNNQDGLERQKACETLSLNKISELMDVDKAIIQQDDMSFGEKRSICYFFAKEGNRKFFIRLAWESEKAIENKVLEKRFTKILLNGENDISEYIELTSGTENQILYGLGKDRENKTVHIIRKRFGNHSEIQLEVTKEYKDETLKESLLETIRKIN